MKNVVEGKLGETLKCYGHCTEKAMLVFLPKREELTSCIVCPSGYVSKIITYGKHLDIRGFRNFLSGILKGTVDVAPEDIRVATRYAWDLGLERDYRDVVLREAYWMQSYRRTKSEDPDRVALFLCLNCKSPYTKPLMGEGNLCTNCSGKSSL